MYHMYHPDPITVSAFETVCTLTFRNNNHPTPSVHTWVFRNGAAYQTALADLKNRSGIDILQAGDSCVK